LQFQLLRDFTDVVVVQRPALLNSALWPEKEVK